MSYQIDLLIFDLGNVLIDIDWEKRWSHLAGHVKDENGRVLEIEEISGIYISEDTEKLGEKIQYGQVTNDAFLDWLQSASKYPVDREIVAKSFCDIFSPMTKRVELFRALLKADHPKTVMLSDTCDLHIAHIEKTMPEIFELLPADRRFYSHKIGAMKKYGSDAYRHVLKEMNIAPEKTLMIDDSIANKAGAEAAGLHFAHLLKEDDLAEILKQQWNIVGI